MADLFGIIFMLSSIAGWTVAFLFLVCVYYYIIVPCVNWRRTGNDTAANEIKFEPDVV